MVPRGAVLHAGAAGDGYCAGVRPHHERDWGGDDRVARGVDAVLRHAEEPFGAANPEDVKQGVIAYKIARTPLTWRGTGRGHETAMMRFRMRDSCLIGTNV